MRLITVNLPEGQLEALADLVREGHFPSRAEAIREAVRDLLNYHAKLRGKENLATMSPMR